MGKKFIKKYGVLAPLIEAARKPWYPGLPCAYCERPLDPTGSATLLEATRDHVKPKSKGGKGIKVWACWTCNMLKQDMNYKVWQVYMTLNPLWYLFNNLRRGPVPFTQGMEISIVEGGSLLPCRVVQRYQHNTVWWLILRHVETGTQFRRPEASIEKPVKMVPKLTSSEKPQ